MRVAIIGAGLAGLATGVYLAEAGHEVQIYEARPFVGGKVGSWQDAEGNHIEMGLHVFFCNYSNLFALMRICCPSSTSTLLSTAAGGWPTSIFAFP
jgi:zeta-carotene desaturase